jgi:hypothetical protein
MVEKVIFMARSNLLKVSGSLEIVQVDAHDVHLEVLAALPCARHCRDG